MGCGLRVLSLSRDSQVVETGDMYHYIFGGPAWASLPVLFSRGLWVFLLEVRIMPWKVESFTNYNPAQKQDPIYLHPIGSFPGSHLRSMRVENLEWWKLGSSTFFSMLTGEESTEKCTKISYRVWYSRLITWTKRTPKIWWRWLTRPCWLINIVPYDSTTTRQESTCPDVSFPFFPLLPVGVPRQDKESCSCVWRTKSGWLRFENPLAAVWNRSWYPQ